MEFRSLQPHELALWYDHCDEVFTHTPRQYFVDHYLLDPDRELENTLVAMDKEVIAACVRVIPRKIYLDGQAVTVGGIGDVATKDRYKKQGLSSALLQRAIARIHEKQLCISMLFTDVNAHYKKQGWVNVPRKYVALDLPKEKLPEGAVLRCFTQKDWPAMRAIYDLYAQRFNGVMVRDSAAYWDQWIKSFSSHHYVLEMQDQVQAYISIDDAKHALEMHTLHVQEFAATPIAEQYLPAMIAAVAELRGLPTRALLPSPLLPNAQGNVEQDHSMMLRWMQPFMLSGMICDTQALVDACAEAVFFKADSF